MITQKKLEVLKLYNEGREFYKQKKFQEAIDCFNKALDLDPEDGPSEVYLERCEAFLQNPPDENWDGVFVMTTK